MRRTTVVNGTVRSRLLNSVCLRSALVSDDSNRNLLDDIPVRRFVWTPVNKQRAGLCVMVEVWQAACGESILAGSDPHFGGLSQGLDDHDHDSRRDYRYT